MCPQCASGARTIDACRSRGIDEEAMLGVAIQLEQPD
eukprot:CAMPEP_0183423644 /NCGR_PEP_ID=MMETSP0370-20130417/28633_1 /TAXON_ID=268820 /ORGANISM="Peridinium aciculiferum, Strain PAER-2" /LENGTH=36 /DNA_ID= /DNA_START= /DNA_END= /DNA_ORIENTATION=